jgi:hypothetical protein
MLRGREVSKAAEHCRTPKRKRVQSAADEGYVLGAALLRRFWTEICLCAIERA